MSILNLKKSDSKPVLYAVLLIPSKESISIKLSNFRKDTDNNPFFDYGGVSYFIHNEKITIIDNKLTLLYKIGVSEPIRISGKTEELIFSKELTDALKSKVIKEFRTVENIEVIEQILDRVTMLMILSGVIALVLIGVYLKVKNIDTTVNTELTSIKDLINSIKVF